MSSWDLRLSLHGLRDPRYWILSTWTLSTWILSPWAARHWILSARMCDLYGLRDPRYRRLMDL